MKVVHKEVIKKIKPKPQKTSKRFSSLCHLFHVYQSTLVTVVYLEKWSESVGYVGNDFGEKESTTAKLGSESRGAASAFPWGSSRWKTLCRSTRAVTISVPCGSESGRVLLTLVKMLHCDS